MVEKYIGQQYNLLKIIPIRQDTADFDDPHFTGHFHLQLKPDYTGGKR